MPPRAAPPTPPPRMRAGERADAADLCPRQAPDLVLPQEVARLVGEPAGALLQPRGVDAGLAERAGDLAEDLIEPAAALAEAVGGALQPVLRSRTVRPGPAA